MMGKTGPWLFCVSALFTMIFFLLATPDCFASRFHVKTSGTLTSGPSISDDWSDENCYAEIQLACASAALQDSVLLFRETHNLGQEVEIPQFFGNQDMDFNSSNVTIVLAPLGRIEVTGDFPRLMVRGISFEGNGEDSNYPAINLGNINGQLEQAFIHDCSFINLKGSDLNSALTGGGSAIRADGDGNYAYLEIRECHFENNVCSGYGGAAFFGDNYEIYISDTSFINNLSEGGGAFSIGQGGAIYIKSQNVMTELTMVDCLLDNNKARGPGGAIGIDDGSLVLIATDILNSKSAFEATTYWSAGAGLLMRGNGSHDQIIRLEMWGCEIIGNVGDLSAGTNAGDGGGVVVKGISGNIVDVYIAECSFEDNYNAQGAGLYIGRFTVGEVERCSFRNNSAYQNGGGAYKGGVFEENLGETVVFNYCEFVGNRAGYTFDGEENDYQGRGGAFTTRLYPRAFFYNCSFLDNYTGPTLGNSDAIYMRTDGGSFDDDLKRCRLVNCLFYGETGENLQIGVALDAFGLITHCAYEAGQINSSAGVPVETVLLEGNPCIDLANTFLISGSGCIDSALPVGLYEDLAGNVVPVGDGPDIGAREFLNPNSPVPHDLGVQLGSIHSARVWPNPFNPRVQVGFDLEADLQVDVTIYDIRGAVVKHLFSGSLPAGPQQFDWDGRDESGRLVASGSYRSVISGGGRQILTRMTLIR